MAYKDLSKKELSSLIREKTQELNLALYEAGDKYTDSFALQQAVKKLNSIGARGRGSNVVGLGLSRNRSKESLVRQLRELDYVTPLLANDGINYLDEKYKKAYRTFVKDHPNTSEEEYRDIMTTFGSLGEEITSKFDSNQIFDLVKDSGKRVDVAQLMLDVLRDDRTDKTPNSNTDEFMRRLAEL